VIRITDAVMLFIPILWNTQNKGIAGKNNGLLLNSILLYCKSCIGRSYPDFTTTVLIGKK